MSTDWDTLQAIAARHGHDLTPTDPRDREIADLRDRLAAAEEVSRQNAALARRLVREQEEDRTHRGRMDAAMMEALPRDRFAGGERVEYMVVRVCQMLSATEAEVKRLTAALDEARLALAAERAEPEGAPSEGWAPRGGLLREWGKVYPDGSEAHVHADGRWWRGWPGEIPHGRRPGREPKTIAEGPAGLKRAAMRAADAAVRP